MQGSHFDIKESPDFLDEMLLLGGICMANNTSYRAIAEALVLSSRLRDSWNHVVTTSPLVRCIVTG
jgi:hypothetical protein